MSHDHSTPVVVAPSWQALKHDVPCLHDVVAASTRKKSFTERAKAVHVRSSAR